MDFMIIGRKEKRKEGAVEREKEKERKILKVKLSEYLVTGQGINNFGLPKVNKKKNKGKKKKYKLNTITVF